MFICISTHIMHIVGRKCWLVESRYGFNSILQMIVFIGS